MTAKSSTESLLDYLKFFPITGIKQYPNGFAEVIRTPANNKKPLTHAERGDILEFTYKSRRRMLFKLAQLDVYWQSFITLTYPGKYPKDGQEVKSDLNRFLSWYRRFWREPGFPQDGDRESPPYYFWFLEFQPKRQAPHFHVITSKPDYRPKAIACIAGQWANQMSEKYNGPSILDGLNAREEALKVYKVHTYDKQVAPIQSSDGALRYAAKYAYKTHQKIVPQNYENVGRFWGVSRGAPLHEGVHFDVDEELLRDYLTHKDHPAADWEFIPKNLFGLSI